MTSRIDLRQLTLDLPARTALGRSDFYVAAANGVALRQIENWEHWPERKLALIGPRASGKTHLAHVWAALSGARIISAEHLPEADISELMQARALVIEDIDLITWWDETARRETEEAIFHLHNHVLQQGGHFMVTARSAPARVSILTPDLASRLRAAQVAELLPPDDELLTALIMKLAEDRQLMIPPNVLKFLLPRMERSFVAAGRLVEELDKVALSAQRPVTIPLATQALSHI